MLFELIKQGRKLTLLSYLFLQVGKAWPMELRRFLSKKGGRKKFLICVPPPCASYPSQSRARPTAASRVLTAAAFLPLLGLSSGFPPIPGLETRKGIQEDSMAATLATAQKLASEDADLVDEDEEVWLWVQDFRV